MTDTAIGRLLQRAFPNVQWEMHHVFVQLPIPKSLNGFLGQNNALGQVATQMFATAYYSILVYGPAYTLAFFMED